MLENVSKLVEFRYCLYVALLQEHIKSLHDFAGNMHE